jgi:hypothetical protein
MGLRCCVATFRIPHFGGLFPFRAYFQHCKFPQIAYLRARQPLSIGVIGFQIRFHLRRISLWLML